MIQVILGTIFLLSLSPINYLIHTAIILYLAFVALLFGTSNDWKNYEFAKYYLLFLAFVTFMIYNSRVFFDNVY